MVFDVREVQLLSSILNEALNGFAVTNFDVVIGMNRPDLELLFAQLNEQSTDEIRLNQRQVSGLRNALLETLRELGIEEFHTRTGFDIEEGEQLLRKLNHLVGPI